MPGLRVLVTAVFHIGGERFHSIPWRIGVDRVRECQTDTRLPERALGVQRAFSNDLFSPFSSLLIGMIGEVCAIASARCTSFPFSSLLIGMIGEVLSPSRLQRQHVPFSSLLIGMIGEVIT